MAHSVRVTDTHRFLMLNIAKSLSRHIAKSLGREYARASDLGIALGFALLLVLVVVSASLSASKLFDLIRASDAARHYETVLQRLDKAADDVTEAERQQRTFFITSDATYLPLYKQSREKVRDSFDELLRLTYSDGASGELIRETRKIIDEKLSLLAHPSIVTAELQEYLDLQQIAGAQPLSVEMRQSFSEVVQRYEQGLAHARSSFDDARQGLRSAFVWSSLVTAMMIFVLASAVLIERRFARGLSLTLLHKSRHDDLTGLPNRAHLTESLERALAAAQRNGHKVALLFLDLNGFKAVNDTFGHKIGDEVLIEFSKIIRALARGGDLVARLGGDEFAVLIPEADDGEQIESATKRFRSVSLAREHLPVTASVGTAVYPDDAADAASLIKLSDALMYQQKRARPGAISATAPQARAAAGQLTGSA
ncbi:MAG TPA: diguanylate cyclase [Burkholderiales bacterium]|nr:diguanylate cyclase [Burkholderiales bacterium]